MSIVSTSHAFTQLTKDSAPMSGQRLVRLIAKASRDGKYPSPHLTESLCVSVPRLTQEEVIESIDRLIPHLVRMCEGVQDKLVREYRIESGRDDVHQDIFGMSQVIAYLDADSLGDRVTREYLAEWFIGSYGDVARDWINTVSGGALAEDIVSSKCDVLRDMIAGWASPKYSPPIPALRASIRFIDHCVAGDVCDSRMAGIREKCVRMLERKENELSADALGF